MIGNYLAIKTSDNSIVPTYQWNIDESVVIENAVANGGGSAGDYEAVPCDKDKVIECLAFGKSITYDGNDLTYGTVTQQEKDDAAAAQAEEEALLDEVEAYIWNQAVDAVKVGKTQAEQDILEASKSTKSAGRKNK